MRSIDWSLESPYKFNDHHNVFAEGRQESTPTIEGLDLPCRTRATQLYFLQVAPETCLSASTAIAEQDIRSSKLTRHGQRTAMLPVGKHHRSLL